MSANQEPDEALGRAVPRAGGASAREHDGDAEEETAGNDGHGLEGAVVRCDDAERRQGGEADGVDGDDDEKGDESAALFLQKDIAQHAGDAEAAALHDGAEGGADDKT